MAENFSVDNDLVVKAIRSSTDGGRSLNAIWFSDLTSSEKLVLQFLGSQLDFRYSFQEPQWQPISRIQMATSLCRRQIFRIIKQLEKKGYLTRKARWLDGKQMASEYAINDKIFNEYTNILLKRAQENNHVESIGGGDFMSPLGVTLCHGGGDTMSPGGCHDVTRSPSDISLPKILEAEEESKQAAAASFDPKIEPSQEIEEIKSDEPPAEEIPTEESIIASPVDEKPEANKIPYQDLLDHWNANRGNLPAILRITEKRREKIRVRWAEDPDLTYWLSVISKFCGTKFAQGSNLNFDWLFANDTNHVKVMEGKYDKEFKPKNHDSRGRPAEDVRPSPYVFRKLGETDDEYQERLDEREKQCNEWDLSHMPRAV